MTATSPVSESLATAWMAAVLQNSLASLTLVDPELNVILSFHRHSGDHLARPLANTSGQSVLAAVERNSQPQVRQFYAEIFKGRAFYDRTQRQEDGQERHYEVAYYPVRDSRGEVVAAAAATREVPPPPAAPAAAPQPAPAPAAAASGPVEVGGSEAAHRLHEELERNREMLVHHDKMASLGRLLAGIVHELNTPIGAAKASGTNLEETLVKVVAQYGDTFRHLPPEGFIFYDWLLSKANDQSAAVLSTRDERKLVRVGEQVLTQAGIAEAYETAQRLVAMGIRDEAGFNELAGYMGIPAATEVVQLAAGIAEMRRNIQNVQLAADKAKAIVNTVKTYTRGGLAEEHEMVNLKASLETILHLYYNQMKYGVELEVGLEEGMFVTGNRDEIGQVWTNLLQNALYAINNKGHVRVNLARVDNHAEIEIQDDGPGIPPDIQHRIFEPFFTTKPMGEGTGIGLDVCTRIVRKYGGRILLESAPGRTLFRIILPLSE